MPYWKGSRSDLITVGGEAPRVDSNWKDTKRDLLEFEKKMIVATMIEISINLVMFIPSVASSSCRRTVVLLASVRLPVWPLL